MPAPAPSRRSTDHDAGWRRSSWTAGPRPAIEYTRVTELRGPLLVVRGVARCRLGRVRDDRLATGAPAGTGWSWRSTATSPSCRCSRAPRAAPTPVPRSAFDGRPLHVPVGPAGSAGSATAAASRSTAARRSSATQPAPVAGWPLNPVLPRAAGRAGDHRRLGDRRADHPGAGPEAAGVLRRRACRTWNWPPRSRRRPRPAGDPFRVVFAGDGPDPCRRRLRPATRWRSAPRPGELVLLLNAADDSGRSSGSSPPGWRSPWPSTWRSPRAGTSWSSWPT